MFVYFFKLKNQVWKDKSKGASVNADKYDYPLPWVPMREGQDSGYFRTLLPEDIVQNLLKYLTFARLKKADIAPSFYDSIGKLDGKVKVSFASAILYLSDAYWAAVGSKDWTQTNPGLSDEESSRQLDEQSEWLCSVADDAHRITDTNMVDEVNKVTLDDAAPDGSVGGGADTDVELFVSNAAAVSSRAYTAFTHTMMRAVDFLSCIIFKTISLEETLAVTFQKGYFAIWDKAAYAAATNDSAVSEKSLIIQIVEFMAELLSYKASSLMPYCYYKLLSVCSDKMVVFYLNHLREALRANKRFTINGPEVKQMIADVNAIKTCFNDAVKSVSETEDFADALQSQFRRLDQAVLLISSGAVTDAFKNTLQSILKVAQGRPDDAIILANFSALCICLRADYDPSVSLVAKNSSIHHDSAISIASTLAGSVARTVGRRGSNMMQYFGLSSTASEGSEASNNGHGHESPSSAHLGSGSGGAVLGGASSIPPHEVHDSDFTRYCKFLIDEMRENSEPKSDEVNSRELVYITPEEKIFGDIPDLTLTRLIFGSAVALKPSGENARKQTLSSLFMKQNKTLRGTGG